MNLSRPWLVLSAALFPLTVAAAPVPVPSPASRPESNIAEVLRLRSILPATSPFVVLPAVIAGEGSIELERAVLEAVEVTRTATVAVPVAREVDETVKLPDGQVVTRKRVVHQTVYEKIAYVERVLRPTGKVRKEQLPLKSCKCFVTTKDGKLDSLDAAKAAELLKNKTAVLTGTVVEVDLRHLDLIKPGTLYLVLPPPALPPMPPLPPDGRQDR